MHRAHCRVAIFHAIAASLILGIVSSPLVVRGAQAENPRTSQKATVKTLPPAPEGVRILENLPYLSKNRQEKLDLYLPTSSTSSNARPAVVIIHGGGWLGGDKSSSREFNIGTTLAKAGYVCVSVEYLKEGHGRWPTNLYDCKNAVRFLRSNAARYNLNGRIGVIGGSAGGHLALMVAYTYGVSELTPEDLYPGVSDRVQACVDFYGITDLLTRQGTEPDGTPNGALRECVLMSEPRDTGIEAWKMASPVYHINKSTPPTLIAHGMADTTVDREQALQLDHALTKAGVEHELMMLPGIGHTFDLDQWKHKPLPKDVRSAVIRFFDKHLKEPEQQ